ncbi:hypothetical protein COLO4_05037 [Corchorus olitorius]|uniref:DUF4283 domain-containing protein n=1 Tax=Corchorus olitorius TaxID=93759 RepID=A0A1R3KS41_9ROSI|nr:hypothetical protein COLO4_05037 [Corchorus olitorius]
MAGNTLLNLCSKLSIQEGEQGKEQTKMVIKKDWIGAGNGDLANFFLIGKLFAKRSANLEGLRQAMIQAWKPELEMTIKEVGERLYLFQF